MGRLKGINKTACFLLIWIAAIFMNGCTLVEKLDYYVVYGSQFVKVEDTDSGRIIGKEYYPIGLVSINYPRYVFPNKWNYDLLFVYEHNNSNYVTSHNVWHLLHNKKAFVMTEFSMEYEMWKDMINTNDVKIEMPTIQPNFINKEGEKIKAFLFYIRADYFNSYFVPYTGCPYLIYKKGMRGEYYKVLFPINEETYQYLIENKVTYPQSDVQLIEYWNDSILNSVEKTQSR